MAGEMSPGFGLISHPLRELWERNEDRSADQDSQIKFFIDQVEMRMESAYPSRPPGVYALLWCDPEKVGRALEEYEEELLDEARKARRDETDVTERCEALKQILNGKCMCAVCLKCNKNGTPPPALCLLKVGSGKRPRGGVWARLMEYQQPKKGQKFGCPDLVMMIKTVPDPGQVDGIERAMIKVLLTPKHVTRRTRRHTCQVLKCCEERVGGNEADETDNAGEGEGAGSTGENDAEDRIITTPEDGRRCKCFKGGKNTEYTFIAADDVTKTVERVKEAAQRIIDAIEKAAKAAIKKAAEDTSGAGPASDVGKLEGMMKRLMQQQTQEVVTEMKAAISTSVQEAMSNLDPSRALEDHIIPGDMATATSIAGGMN